jgi:Domain of unknown function (DUF4326)
MPERIAVPERIQLSRAKGWKMPPNTVKVARPSRWGNPYPVTVFGLELALKLFDNTMHGFWSPGLFDDEPDVLIDLAYVLHCAFRKRHSHQCLAHARSELCGLNLACFCRLEQRCHADILLSLANAPL